MQIENILQMYFKIELLKTHFYWMKKCYQSD